MPVHDGEIENNVYAFAVISVYHLLYDIFLVRTVCNGEISVFAGPHAKAIVVFGGKNQVTGTHFLCLACPFAGIEGCRVKLIAEVVILFIGHEVPRAYLFGGIVIILSFPESSGNGIQSPMYELSQSVLAPTLHFRVCAFTDAVGTVFQRDGGALSLCVDVGGKADT